MGKMHEPEYMARRLLRRSRVDEATPLLNGVHCRVWTGRSKDKHGYAKMWNGERVERVHRQAHRAWIGPIPEGLDVMHHCDNPGCIEPLHIKAATAKENVQDMVRKGRHLAGRRVASEKTRGRPSLFRGERHARAVLTREQAIEIKAMATDRPGTAEEIGARYEVSASTIYAIWRGNLWAWLDPAAPVYTDVPPVYRPPKVPAPVKYALGDPRRPRFVGKKLKEALRG